MSLILIFSSSEIYMRVLAFLDVNVKGAFRDDD